MAPSLVYSSAQPTTTSGTLTSTSFTPQVGDVIVVKLVAEDSVVAFNTPTGGGWTYTSRVSDTTASHVSARIYTAVPSSGGTPQTVSVTATWGASSDATMVVELWRNAKLAASPATCDTRGSGAPSTTLTTAAANSVVSWCDGDWNAATGTATYNTTSATPTQDGNTQVTGRYCAYFAYQAATSAGSQTLGMTAPAGQAWTLLGIEIQASATTWSGTSALSGSGTLTATGAFAGSAALNGAGTLSWSGSRIYKATVLNGSGTLSGAVIGTLNETAALDGEGTLAGSGAATLFSSAALSGAGALTVSGFSLGVALALAGTGTLSIIGTGGTVQAASAPASPYAWPGTSQVAVAPPGTTAWQYLGTLGIVTSLTYSFTCPGGADKLTCTVMIPASYRTSLLNPGWQVRVTRGGHVVWTGRMDEPVPSASGWQVTAVGDGNRGQDFRAIYTSTWPAGEPDQAVNNAISRGLPWVNPGVGTPSGIWLGQAQDSGASTVADLLNLACTRGGLTWYVNSQPGGQPGSDLSVFPLPTAVNRLLIVTQPVPRTLGGDINTIYLRYEISDGQSSGTSATFGTTSVQNAASVAAHGVLETYIDLSSAGVMTASAAQAVGNHVLAIYVRASFAGPFTASYGQLLNAGGQPVDPGADQAGTVVKPLLTDYAYGGEVAPGSPITFCVGSYSWDDFAQKATLSPYQVLDQSLSGLLSMETTTLTPITTQQ